MALSKETQAWLEDLRKEGNISDDKFKELVSSFEGKADEFVKGSVLRQSDYSRVMSEVKAAQKAVDDAQEALVKKEQSVTKYQGELATWKKGADENFQKAIQEREQASVKANAALARLKSLAVANGLDENEVLKDLDTVVIPAKKDEPNVDTSRFVTRDDIQKTVAESALIDASIHDIAMEYQELTGQPLRNAAALVQEAMQAKQTLTQYVANKFKFADLRKAKDDAAIQKRIDDAVAAERTKILSDANIPGNLNGGLRTDLKGSPILGNMDKVAKIPGVDEHTPGGGVSAAVAAFNAGKFKQ